MTISSKFAKKAGLQCISISPQKLQQIAGSLNQLFTKVAYRNLDINRHQ